MNPLSSCHWHIWVSSLIHFEDEAQNLLLSAIVRTSGAAKSWRFVARETCCPFILMLRSESILLFLLEGAFYLSHFWRFAAVPVLALVLFQRLSFQPALGCTAQRSVPRCVRRGCRGTSRRCGVRLRIEISSRLSDEEISPRPEQGKTRHVSVSAGWDDLSDVACAADTVWSYFSVSWGSTSWYIRDKLQLDLH